jgi:hypothetical protein
LPLLAASRINLSETELDATALWDAHLGLYMTAGRPTPLPGGTRHDTASGLLGLPTLGARFHQATLPRPPRQAFSELYPSPKLTATDYNRMTEEPALYGARDDYYFDLLRQQQSLADLKQATVTEDDPYYELSGNTKTNAKKIGELAIMQFAQRWEPTTLVEDVGPRKYSLQTFNTGPESGNNAPSITPWAGPHFSTDVNAQNAAYLANVPYYGNVLAGGVANYGVYDHQNNPVAYGNYQKMQTHGPEYGATARVLKKLEADQTRKPILITDPHNPAQLINIRQVRPRKSVLNQAVGRGPNERGTVRYGELVGDAEDSEVLAWRQRPEPEKTINTQLGTATIYPPHLLPQGLLVDMSLTTPATLPLPVRAETEGLLALPTESHMTKQEVAMSGLPREAIIRPTELITATAALPTMSNLQHQEWQHTAALWAEVKAENLSLTLPSATGVSDTVRAHILPPYRPMGAAQGKFDDLRHDYYLAENKLASTPHQSSHPLFNNMPTAFPQAPPPTILMPGLSLTQPLPDSKGQPPMRNGDGESGLHVKPLHATINLTHQDRQSLQFQPLVAHGATNIEPLGPVQEDIPQNYRSREIREPHLNPLSLTEQGGGGPNPNIVSHSIALIDQHSVRQAHEAFQNNLWRRAYEAEDKAVGPLVLGLPPITMEDHTADTNWRNVELDHLKKLNLPKGEASAIQKGGRFDIFQAQ